MMLEEILNTLIENIYYKLQEIESEGKIDYIVGPYINFQRPLYVCRVGIKIIDKDFKAILKYSNNSQKAMLYSLIDFAIYIEAVDRNLAMHLLHLISSR